MSDWQPIETAPRDGTIILAYDPACHPDVYTVRFEHEHWAIADAEAFSTLTNPTHWMPLPSPPEIGK